MKTSNKTGELAKSLFAFQRDVTPPRTDARADTGKFSYPYLTLPGLLAHCRPQLEAWGLTVIQEIQREEGGVGVTTRVIHAPSDEWIELGPLFLPATGTPQNFGSAITYGRRYSFAAALGIAADDDDDVASVNVEPRSTVTGSSEATGMAAADGSGAPASDPTSGESPAYGEGAGGSLLITDEQLEVLKVAAGGVQKARAASKATYSKDWRELTADEALALIQKIQKVKEDAA